MHYRSNASIVTGTVKICDENKGVVDMKQDTVHMNYMRTWGDEVITISAGGVSITVTVKDIKALIAGK